MFELYNTLSDYFLPVNFLLSAIVIFRERKNPASVWAWVMMLFFLPIVGFILYLLFGRELKNSDMANSRGKNSRQLASEQIKHGIDQYVSVKESKEVSKFKDLIHMQLLHNYAPITERNKLVTFTDGQKKFNNLIKDIRAAENHIHLQYYIVRGDKLGKKMVQLLTEKAQQGVKVRLLYDGMGSFGLKRSFFSSLIEQGGEVKAFFPAMSSLLRARLNYRNHRKIVVVDGKIAYMGGFNIGDEYVKPSKKFGYWRDTHFRVEGTAAHNLQDIFLEDWEKSTQQKVEEYDSLFPEPDLTGSTPIQLVTSGADSRWNQVKNGFLKMINHAEEYLYIQTPYLIPDTSILNSILIASLSGVDVRIMIPNKPDHPFVHWATYSYAEELMHAGVKIYIYDEGFLHAKTITVDDQLTTIGTANVDMRSLSINFEVNAFIYEEKAAVSMRETFLQDIEQSKELTMEDYKSLSLWIKFKIAVSRLISPLL